jgi:hypothetical protein
MGGMALFAHLILDSSTDNINRNYSPHPSSTISIEGAIGKLNLISYILFYRVLIQLLLTRYMKKIL